MVQPKTSFESIIQTHMQRYPGSQIEDVYKLVFQASMGCDHAARDLMSALRYLENEAAGLAQSDDAALIMPISPEHALVRIHLGPYLRAGGDLKALAEAFVKTSQIFKPSIDRLASYWSWVEALAVQGILPFAPHELQRYGEERRTERYPALHHSSQYRRLYRPAYRIVLKNLLAMPMQHRP